MNSTLRWLLTALTVAGLAVDAYIHFDLASLYQFNRTNAVSEETLFRVEAILAVIAAIAVIVRANVWTALLAVSVAGGGLALLLVYRYVDVGKVGPVPDMYEPIWFTKKTFTALGEGLATIAAAGLLILSRVTGRAPSAGRLGQAE